MTYEVYIDDRLLFYPNDEAYAITGGVVENALSEAGTFQCDIPKTNPEYEGIESKVRSAMIKVNQNGKEIFYGEIREVIQNFNMTKHVYCVGELAFLFDSIQPQAHYQGTPFAMLQEVIRLHNNQVEARKQFSVGYVSIGSSSSRVNILTNFEDTLTVIRALADTLGGYVRIRKVGDKRHVDIVPLENYGKYCTQEIQFGENLLDYSANTSATDIATAVIPLGAKLEADQRTTDSVNGLDEYLSIKSVNSGIDYVFNQSAVNRFGWVKVVKHWDDVVDPAQLKTLAEEWLKSVQFESMELEVNAFDGNLLDINVDSFDVGDTVHAWAVPYGMDTIFPVRKKTTYINEVSQNYITLGTTLTKSYTSQASSALNLLEEQLPQESELLRQAKENALNMLNGSVGGHVIMQFDPDNKYVEQILITNASTEKLSTQKWVWNLNGFGYMHRDTINDEWTKLETAITMNGEIVANFITTGVMAATRIAGGTLSLGGSDKGNYKNGSLKIYDSSNKEIGSWDRSGINIKQGEINLGDGVFKVTNEGKLTASSGTFGGDLDAAGGTFSGTIKSASFIGNTYYSSDKKDYIDFTGSLGSLSMGGGAVTMANSSQGYEMGITRLDVKSGGAANFYSQANFHQFAQFNNTIYLKINNNLVTLRDYILGVIGGKY